MTDISRVALFGKLNSVCYKSIEEATVFCKMRGNPYVDARDLKLNPFWG
jgi:type VI secretion system protein VasG